MSSLFTSWKLMARRDNHLQFNLLGIERQATYKKFLFPTLTILSDVLVWSDSMEVIYINNLYGKKHGRWTNVYEWNNRTKKPFLELLMVCANASFGPRIFFLINSFMEMSFPYHTIHSFKVYDSVVFSMFTELCSHHQSKLRTFLFPRRLTPSPQP